MDSAFYVWKNDLSVMFAFLADLISLIKYFPFSGIDLLVVWKFIY